MPDSSESIHPPFSSRDRILLAAKHLFARNGYENTSTVTIAREAGTSESQLMKHFGSKQGLLAAIFERGWESFNQRVRATQRSGPPAERLFALLEALVIELENDGDLKDLMMLEAKRVRKDNRDVLITRGMQHFADAIDELLGEMSYQGQIRADLNLDATRAAIIGMTEGLIRDQVLAQRMGYPAAYGIQELRGVFNTVIEGLVRK